MAKKPFWERWEPLVPLEPAEEMELELSNIEEVREIKHLLRRELRGYNVTVYRKCKRKKCVAPIDPDIKKSESAKTEAATPIAGPAKETEYDLNGFIELDENLKLSMLKSQPGHGNKISDPLKGEAYQKIIDNIAANATYCNEIMKAEMDKLGIQESKLTKTVYSNEIKTNKLTENPGPSKLQEDKETENHNTIKKIKPTKIVIVVEPKNENSPNMTPADDVDQIMLMFKLMDHRNDYKNMHQKLTEIKNIGTKQECLDLQIKLMLTRIKMETIKHEMYGASNLWE